MQKHIIARAVAIVTGAGLVAISILNFGSSPVEEERRAVIIVATTTLQDGLEHDRAKALQARIFKALHEERFAKYAAFCGGADNVLENGFGWTDVTRGVSGCKDYSKVPAENL